MRRPSASAEWSPGADELSARDFVLGGKTTARLLSVFIDVAMAQAPDAVRAAREAARS